MEHCKLFQVSDAPLNQLHKQCSILTIKTCLLVPGEQSIHVRDQFPQDIGFFSIQRNSPSHLYMVRVPLPQIEFRRTIIPANQIDLLFPPFRAFRQYSDMADDREPELPVFFHCGRFPSFLRHSPHIYATNECDASSYRKPTSWTICPRFTTVSTQFTPA